MSAESLVSAWRRGRDLLTAAGVDSPVLDSRLLLEAATGVERVVIVTDPYRVVSEEEVGAFDGLLARRIAREPMSHILGRKAFWTLDFKVTPDVLAPRPETEFVVEAVVAETSSAVPLQVLDFGVGTGAILLSILSVRPLAMGLGIDVSPAALDVAAHNANALGFEDRVTLMEGAWGEGLQGHFDVIVSNPPYIPTGDLAGLDPEVARFEPVLALDGGADGLEAYRALAPHIARLLAPEGIAVLEFGLGQADAVAEILGAAGLATKRLVQDLTARPRVWIVTHRGSDEKTLGNNGAAG